MYTYEDWRKRVDDENIVAFAAEICTTCMGVSDCAESRELGVRICYCPDTHLLIGKELAEIHGIKPRITGLPNYGKIDVSHS